MALALCLALALAGAPLSAAQDEPDLAAPDAARADLALHAALARGGAGAQAALDGFERGTGLERRARAEILRLSGRASEVEPTLRLLADQDPEVRASLVRFLGRPDLESKTAHVRVSALERIAADDPEIVVRARARVALRELDLEESLAALDRLIDVSPGIERVEAARELGAAPRARELVRRRVLGAEAVVDEPLLTALLPAFGRALAEIANGGADARERRALEIAARSADPELRHAAEGAFERLLARLAALGEHEREREVLALFESDGFALNGVLEARARFEIARGNDPHAALAAAEKGARVAHGDDDPLQADGHFARALRLSGMAHVAALELPQAEHDLTLASGVFARLVEARRDAGGPRAAGEQSGLFAELSLCDLARGFCALVASGEPPDPCALDVLEALRAAHLHALEGQLAAWRTNGVDAANSWDHSLASDDGPVDLLVDRERRPVSAAHAAPAESKSPEHNSSAHALALREALGRALATVTPAEAVGFEPCANVAVRLSDPLQDPDRRARFDALLLAAIERAQDELERATRAAERIARAEPSGPTAAERTRLLELRVAAERALESLGEAQSGEPSALLDLRAASWFALTTARALRDEGQGKEARELLGRAREAIEKSGAAQRWLWGLEMLAEIEATGGASFTDDEEPRRAEVELLRAVDRLQALEDLLKERGFAFGALALVRAQRANALVSLAVNANVKLRDQDKARGYFERAWELRQDEFTRVLLACYRARAGRIEEARAALDGVVPGPGNHYNMACAYALLGEKDAALDYLRRELDENQPTNGARERQKAWARSDPDLDSLHGDPRFEALVGAH